MRAAKSSLILSFCLLVCGVVEAQVVRTWVASNGSDANSCTRALPCRNFAEAIAAVDAGGEVVALDSAGYGPVTINKSVSVIAPLGVHAAIAPTAGTGITVSAGRVTLRNLYLKGNGAFYGIEIQSSGTTFVEQVTIDGFAATGIGVQASELFLTDSISRNNAESGVGAAGNSALQMANITITRCRFEKNGGHGVAGSNFSSFSVRDSASSANAGDGFRATPGRMSLMNCHASGNVTGVQADFGGVIRLSHCDIVHNVFGLSDGDSGVIYSQGNNFVHGNTTTNVDATLSTFGGT